MTDVNHRAIIREVLEETDETDPAEVAKMVVERIDRRRYKAVLTVLMRAEVRDVYSSMRTGRIESGEKERQREPSRPAAPSSKVKGIREAWKAHLRDRLHVAPGTYKQLVACTYDDLMYAAKERREQAYSFRAWAGIYEAWAKELREHKAETFGDLPTGVQERLLTGEAAA